MNILLIIPYNWGTIGRISYNLYKNIRLTPNCKIYVVCLGNYSKDGQIFDDCFHLKTVCKSNIFSMVFLLRRIKRKYHIKISISTLVNANYWNVLSSISEYKIGIFHTKLSQAKARGYLFYSLQYFLNKFIASRLDKKIAVNKSAYYDTKKLIGGNVELVYNIHDFHKITQLSLEPLPSRFNLIFSKPVILFVGSGNYLLKAPERLIKAFSEIKDAIPTHNLVFLGQWNESTLTFLKKNIADENLTDRVFFLGYSSNPYQYMANSDLLVSTSRDEGLPGVLIEALSLGLKCVCTNSTQGVWEIMECDDKYDPYLNDIFESQYGYIVPNDLKNETFTVHKIGEGILKCLSKPFPLKKFNKKRFLAENIVPHFLQS